MVGSCAKVPVDAVIQLAGSEGEAWLRGKVTVVLNKPPGLVSNLPSRGETEACSLVTRRNAHRPRGGLEHAAAAAAADDDGASGGWDEAEDSAYELNVCGRLDKDSRGLLILTQDGVLAKAIIGGNNVPKTYEVEVDATAGRGGHPYVVFFVSSQHSSHTFTPTTTTATREADFKKRNN